MIYWVTCNKELIYGEDKQAIQYLPFFRNNTKIFAKTIPWVLRIAKFIFISGRFFKKFSDMIS